ncbi:mitochondrial 28S ribosomal protein S21, putative [Pediculus humanus corporis]|uniref:Mitochondrial 28S ribosomal protein S21, putative n=1 Tax=Pediculus humanus subsp. corporis TaxID=121224 RepID=E0VZL9_PEDHC|nr:mitochondrial 28S ribosomal protein S21, putative [Pediculus humanus corporis]EEB18825.1 mitochondrial 28S ribosomal protein S21, putative [Pediculus humanus corporis]
MSGIRKFMMRTVLVKDNEVESALRVLNSILGKEGIIDDHRRIQRYEKPWQTRRRINYEKMKALYSEEMSRKINFLMRKNRTNPYPGC